MAGGDHATLASRAHTFLLNFSYLPILSFPLIGFCVYAAIFMTGCGKKWVERLHRGKRKKKNKQRSHHTLFLASCTQACGAVNRSVSTVLLFFFGRFAPSDFSFPVVSPPFLTHKPGETSKERKKARKRGREHFVESSWRARVRGERELRS